MGFDGSKRHVQRIHTTLFEPRIRNCRILKGKIPRGFDMKMVYEINTLEEQHGADSYVDWMMTTHEDERKCENLESSMEIHKDEVEQYLKKKYPEDFV